MIAEPTSDDKNSHQNSDDESVNPALAVLRAVDQRVKPGLKRAIPALLLTLLCFIVGERLGGLGRTTPGRFNMFGRSFVVDEHWLTVIVLVLALVFVLAGVVATRSIGNELARVSENKAGVSAASAIRLICTIVGYVTVALALLSLLDVDLGNLLVGGAVTGVVIGIAAQQTLGNFFAGLVLLFARPYVPGQRVKVRTGAMGGPFEGVITVAGLLYTVIETDEGPISMPNSGLLGAAIGPAPEPNAEDGPTDDGYDLPGMSADAGPAAAGSAAAGPAPAVSAAAVSADAGPGTVGPPAAGPLSPAGSPAPETRRSTSGE